MPLTKEDLLTKHTPLTKVLIIGEDHSISNPRRALESEILRAKYGSDVKIYLEYNFPSGLVNQQGNPIMGDPVEDRLRYICHKIIDNLFEIDKRCNEAITATFPEESKSQLDTFKANLLILEHGINAAANKVPLKDLSTDLTTSISHFQTENSDLFDHLKTKIIPVVKETLAQLELQIEKKNPSEEIIKNLDLLVLQTIKVDQCLAGYSYPIDKLHAELLHINTNREKTMIQAANRNTQKGNFAIWKIGQKHILNMLDKLNPNYDIPKLFTIQSMDDFEIELKKFKTKKEIRKNSNNREPSTHHSNAKKRKLQ